eukprot:TRINITY_DN28309_c0_g2_i1.p1 TRINITY_DN28309_c0_g2~~TRINITY_DN28309_c0_g2_i1.p1  ORF type:complete len:791 (-),score=159.03 TRINITY_DN28309_c0_g2_i1:16-2388(-)
MSSLPPLILEGFQRRSLVRSLRLSGDWAAGGTCAFGVASGPVSPGGVARRPRAATLLLASLLVATAVPRFAFAASVDAAVGAGQDVALQVETQPAASGLEADSNEVATGIGDESSAELWHGQRLHEEKQPTSEHQPGLQVAVVDARGGYVPERTVDTRGGLLRRERDLVAATSVPLREEESTATVSSRSTLVSLPAIEPAAAGSATVLATATAAASPPINATAENSGGAPTAAGPVATAASIPSKATGVSRRVVPTVAVLVEQNASFGGQAQQQDATSALVAENVATGGGALGSTNGTAAAAAEAEEDANEGTEAGFKGASAVQVASAINPLSKFTLDGSDTWTQWPGLKKEIHLFSECVILAQYQTSTHGMNTHVMSRMTVDGSAVSATRSAQGNTKYATTFGVYTDSLAKGKHVILVQYRTSAAGNIFSNGGQDWQTRALNILALPEAQVNAVAPTWKFKLSSADLWSEWSGFEQEVEMETQTTVMCIYTAVVPGKNLPLASKLYLDGREEPASRSIAGETAYAQNTGFFANAVPAGRHVWTVKYRTKARNNFFNDEPNDWMARSLNIITLPGAEAYTIYNDTVYTTARAQSFEQWRGLLKQIALTSDRYVIAMYSVALKSHNDDFNVANIKSVLSINGEEQKQTRSRCGDAKYCQLLGMWMGVLTPGEHKFSVSYMSTAELKLGTEEGDDYSNRALFIVVLSQIESQISFLQTKETVEEYPSATEQEDSSHASFIDLNSRLTKVKEMEKLVNEGRAPKAFVEKLRALQREGGSLASQSGFDETRRDD